MSGKSAIEWTDATWNPVTGCSKVSPGCANCYAETISLRFGHSVKPWTPENAEENVVLHPDRLDQPLKWRAPRMVFVNSMSDLFHEEIPADFIARVFNVMAMAHRHTFQVLTKRPERARDFLLGFYEFLYKEPTYTPIANVWLGVSIENSRFTWRADVLREVPAAVRFISAEPLLGSLFAPRDFERHPATDCGCNGPDAPTHEVCLECGDDLPCGCKIAKPLDLTGIDWLIVGGESGGRAARPMHPDWARELLYACVTHPDGVPFGGPRTGPAFFFKQWGSHDEHGVYRGASPKSGGRLLDGQEWNEMPHVLNTDECDSTRQHQGSLLSGRLPVVGSDKT